MEVAFEYYMGFDKYIEVLDHLVEKNTKKYNHLKAVEELLELAQVLQKKVLKEDQSKEPTDQSIIDEIGDAMIRLEVLGVMYNNEKVNDRICYKLEKFAEYIKDSRYQNI